jgi:hypothetical protein
MPLLAVVSGEGSPEPPGVRMNKPTESLLHGLTHGLLQTKIRVAKSDGIHLVSNDHYFSYAFSLHSWKALANQKCRFKKLCGLIAS